MNLYYLGINNIAKVDKNAETYFKNLYPDIKYNEEDDSYTYREIEFNYFKSGVCINGGIGSFLLVAKDNNQWLFTYGNLEDRWRDFISTRNKK